MPVPETIPLAFTDMTRVSTSSCRINNERKGVPRPEEAAFEPHGNENGDVEVVHLVAAKGAIHENNMEQPTVSEASIKARKISFYTSSSSHSTRGSIGPARPPSNATRHDQVK